MKLAASYAARMPLLDVPHLEARMISGRFTPGTCHATYEDLVSWETERKSTEQIDEVYSIGENFPRSGINSLDFHPQVFRGVKLPFIIEEYCPIRT